MNTSKSAFRLGVALALSGLVVLTGACGYHLQGTRGDMPASLKSVAIPDFRNQTGRVLVDQMISAAVRSEFVRRMRLQLVTDSAKADCLLEGEIVDFAPTLLSYSSQTALYTYSVTVTLNFKFIDLGKNELLYTANNFKVSLKFDSDNADMYTWDNQTFIKALEDMGNAVTSAILDNF
jgi:outer membrane lipopolysaccharide assembly protein LptE/RlpB